MAAGTRKYRKDYRPPDYRVEELALDFDIRDDGVRVAATLQVHRNPAAEANAPLRLDGREMQLLDIAIDGAPLAQSAYELDAEGLTLPQVPARFELTTQVAIDPDANTALEGLYRSGAMLCTQCEAQGFSRITYFPDRPDVMARYSVRVEADAARYPVLLSNGDRVEAGELAGGRHYAVYEDPFVKPCYLFALVAGDLACVEESYRTGSGRDVALRFYTDHGSEGELEHAVTSLKQAMAWDERVYGLEYDLDTYMVVAVGSFNMGAMENKGLNIFNTACVLASPETASDRDYATVRDVIAHEYFHNYTGNRVTCRDWFQLSLKESLTVFREQQFAADHGSPGVTRIEQARLIRDVQFPEDAGPNAHPVRPESYIEMNNFYTITIYQKGAELIRMMHRILGHQAFVRGVRDYLERHDGEAATIEDFVTALEASASADLGQFRRWYEQAGTPVVRAEDEFEGGAYRLTLRQHTPDTPGQRDKPPLHIPVALALFEDGAAGQGEVAELLHLTESEQRWHYANFQSKPTPSLLRGFSAPVRLDYPYSDAQLARLMVAETDGVARWEACQRLALNALQRAVAGDEAPPDTLIEALRPVVRAAGEPGADTQLLAEMLSLPGERALADLYPVIDIATVIRAHAQVKHEVATALAPDAQRLLDAQTSGGAYRFEAEEVGRRSLAAQCLDFLAAAGAAGIEARCLALFESADNMTVSMAALNALRDKPGEAREAAFAAFECRGANHDLVLDKWFALHASSRVPGALDQVRELLTHPRFNLANPNRVRALIGTFSRANLPAFHAADGRGYAFLAEQILALDPLNPQIAARLVTPLADWRRYAAPNGEAMRAQLQRIRKSGATSSDVYEMVEKALASE